MEKTEEYLREMVRLDSPYIGIVPDSSLFCRRPPRVVGEYCKQVYGTNSELVAEAEAIYAEGKDTFDLAAANGGQMAPPLLARVKDPAKDMFYAVNLDGYENKPLSVMDPYVKYIKHFHFKFYEMTEDGEYSIDYREILQYLHDHGYDGYVSSEYEGNRWVLPDHPIPEVEQVTAHQKYVQKLIREMEG